MGKEIYKKTSDGLTKLGTIIDDPATKSESVQKSGDTMTGSLVINKSGTTGLVVGGTATNISTSIANETTVLQIDAGTGGATNSSAIGFHNPNISSAVLEYRNTDANTGYFNFKSDDTTWSVKINGNTIIDAGNISSQSVASAIKATQDGNGNTISSTYLPLAGGTMKNGATIAFANSGHWSTESTSNSGVTFPYSCGGLSWSDQSDGVSFYAEATGNDNLDLVIKFTDDNSNKLSIRNASGTQTAYITSSGTGYFTGGVNAATKATQDGSGNVITSTYVNLTNAQTISGIKTFSKSSGFNYSGIETATSDSSRNVWFSHATNVGTPVKNDNFKYNPSTNTLQVGKFYGKETMLKESDSSYTATVGGYDMYTWDDDFCISLRNTDETHNFYILQYDYSASKLITSNNLTAKALTTSQNSNYIDFVTYSGTNFGVQGNSGTVYNLASFAKSADLKKVATSGSYSDLSNQPTIGNGTLTLQRNFTELGQFSANQTGSKTINISVPTKLSELTNDLVNNGTLTIQAEGTTKGTFTANQSGASTINLKASDFGLSSALKFLGTSSTEITEGSTTSKITLTDGTTVTATTGNVVLYGHKEFIWNAAWEELGDESSHALKSVTVTGTGVLSGGGSLETNRTITHNTATRVNTTSSTSPAVGATFTVIDSVTSDNYGHIHGVNTKTVTMPYDTSKLPLTGGAIRTNNITTSAGLATVNGLGRIANTMQLGANGIVIVSPTTVNDCAWIRLTSSANESEELEIATGDDGTIDFNVHFRGYNTSNQAAVDIALPKASGTVALTSDIPSSLKNPNAISFKNASGSTVSYDGSSVLDLTNGVYYATNADKLDGLHADATNAAASTIVARDSNGFIYGKYFNSAISNEDTMSLASVYCSNDNWIRKMAPASFRNTNAVRKWCMVGSDTASTSGYYKVASQTLSGYGDSNVTFMVTSTYGNYMSGILQLQMRSDNTSISCKKLGWLTRNGFSDTGAVICVVSSMTYTIYAKQSMTQYGRIMFEVISESSISTNSSGITLYNSSTPESTAPTATVNDSDIGYVNSANTATNVGLSVSGSGTNSITIKAGNGTAAAFTVNNVANATYATSSGKATQDGSGNTITSTYVKKISASDTKVYANSGGTDTSYTISSTSTAANTLVFRNGSTGYSVINTPADTSTTSTYIANTGWVNTKLNNKADKATTLAGYGITDAKISNGTITLGSNSITPLTSHLTVDSALSSTSTNPVQNKVINSALSGKASSSHTHTTSLASSTGTSSITLAHGGKYQLTTGGTSVIFTMPSDSDTHYTNSLAIQGNGTTATTFSQNANKTLNIVGSGATTVSATTDKITITSTDTNTWRGIQNNLTSTSTTDSLSAAQGKALNEAKVAKSGDTMTGTLTLPQASFSGKVYMEYNSTTDSLDTIFN